MKRTANFLRGKSSAIDRKGVRQGRKAPLSLTRVPEETSGSLWRRRANKEWTLPSPTLHSITLPFPLTTCGSQLPHQITSRTMDAPRSNRAAEQEILGGVAPV